VGFRARAGGLRRDRRPHAQAGYTPHGTYARDLWLFVKILGFSAMEAIVAATRLGGEIMSMPGELGVVKPGALADLLLVDGDPLADITILQDRNALRMIMKDGALYKAPTLS
jgi:imidazolonepropionase-like amidohydrolase